VAEVVLLPFLYYQHPKMEFTVMKINRFSTPYRVPTFF